jgi:methylglutaconyl-CoA hydratase
MPLVNTVISHQVGTITLNRPEKRNALSPALVAELKEAFRAFEQLDEVKVVVLSAEGKAFCAGADLAYLQDLQSYSSAENLEDSKSLGELFQLIYNYPKAVIASVQGHAIAGGCGLASVCDFILTVPEAKFGYTEVRIGFVPAIVSFFLLRKIGESLTRKYLLTGELFQADEFKESGLIYQVCANHDDLKDQVNQLARLLIERNSGSSMTLTKQLISEMSALSIDQAMQRAAEVNASARMTDDCKKGIGSFLSGEKIQW